MNDEKKIGHVRFEQNRPNRPDGSKPRFDFGVKVVCEHCGTQLRVLGATVKLHIEEYPTAVLEVAGVEMDGIHAHVVGVTCGDKDDDSR